MFKKDYNRYSLHSARMERQYYWDCVRIVALGLSASALLVSSRLADLSGIFFSDVLNGYRVISNRHCRKLPTFCPKKPKIRKSQFSQKDTMEFKLYPYISTSLIIPDPFHIIS